MPSRFVGDIPVRLTNRAGYREERWQTTVSNDYAFLHPSTLNVKSGDLVHHAKFGEGVVVEVLGSGSDYEVTVSFKEEGIKRLLFSYAQLEKLE